MLLPSLAFAGAVGIALACWSGSAGARVYDPATTPKARYVAPLATWPAPSYRAKDFSIIESGGQFHLFYTRLQRHVPFHAGSGATQVLNETCIGHAVSNDLETWTELDTVLAVRPGQWDEHHVWAPSLVSQNGFTYLFYGGVRDSMTSVSPPAWIPRFQRIGMAISSDPGLNVWFRPGSPIWQPCAGAGFPGVPWATCMPYTFIGTADFRDPFVLAPDPAVAGSTFSLFYTARVKTDQFNYVVGVANTVSPLSAWTDGGALWDTHYPPGNSKVESPHVFRKDADYHMFFSGDDVTNGIVWMSSFASPLGPWTNRGTLRGMFPKGELDGPYPFELDVRAWFASEQFRRNYPSGPVDYFCVVHAYDAPAAYNPPGGASEDITAIEFRQMVWQPDGTFTFAAPNPVRAAAWSGAGTRTGSTVRLRLTVEGAAGRSADLAASVIRNGTETSINPSAIGLPRSVELVDGTTDVLWTVPPFGAWLPLDFKVRVANQPLAASATIRISSWGTGNEGDPEVAVDPPIVRAMLGSSPEAALETPPGGNGSSLPAELALRLLPHASFGAAGQAFALDLPSAGRARLELYDVRGRRMRIVYDEVASAGRTVARWDGKDDAGRAAPRGIYFARLTSGAGDRSVRLLHVGP
jgi:hypothetical protein